MIQLDTNCAIIPRYLNRHGLISGATGSGKSVTLMRIIDQCAALGIPVLATDLKGDLSTLAQAGSPYDVATLYTHPNAADPFRLPAWQLGPDIIARMIDASTQQRNALNRVFEYLDYRGESPVTLADISAAIHPEFGGFRPDAARASVDAMRRKLEGLQARSGLIGEATHDFRPNVALGSVTLIEATTLGEFPRVYGAFMTWLLEKLFRDLPEVGDLDRPKLVVIVDEAHLLFDGLTPELFEGIERIVRLIRSRGVGLWFASQNPQDVPAAISAQLATRVVHAMRPGQGAAVRGLISGLPAPANGNGCHVPGRIDASDIMRLPPGHAFVTTLDRDGRQGLTAYARIGKPRVALGRVQPIPFGEPQAAQSRAAGSVGEHGSYTPTQNAALSPLALVGLIATLCAGAGLGLWLAWLPFVGDVRAPHPVWQFAWTAAGVVLGAFLFTLARSRLWK